MNYAKIDPKDSTNGVGFGVSLFVSGCRNHCKGCFNPETWDFHYGEEFTDETMNYIIDLVSRPYIDFFSVLGGDPFEEENRECTLNIIRNVKQVRPDIEIFIWTGRLFEDVINTPYINDILSKSFILVDGKFILEEKDIKLFLQGSQNQRILDCKVSLKEHKPVSAFKTGIIQLPDGATNTLDY